MRWWIAFGAAALACVEFRARPIDDLAPDDAGIADVQMEPEAPCAPNRVRCEGQCRDLSADVAHCGACGQACAVGQRCTAGVCNSCPEGMAFIPRGTFSMGAPADELMLLQDARPQRQVTLGAYCLGRNEVTVAEYRRCVMAGRCTPPNSSQPCNWTPSGREDHPINCIDWMQAREVCAFLFQGGRLPTEAEWENAAGVRGMRRYPWGNAAPMDQLCWSGGSMLRAGTCAVGSFPMGETPTGIRDLAGGVLEWVSDWYGPYPAIAETDPGGPITGTGRVYRGGSWNESSAAGVNVWVRLQSAPSLRTSILGARCALGARSSER